MGASDFYVIAEGEDAQSAFQAAVEHARHQHGHGGFTGTIAEKRSVVVIDAVPQPRASALELALRLVDDEDPRIDDKRGPAGAIAVQPAGCWLLFGWAPD